MNMKTHDLRSIQERIQRAIKTLQVHGGEPWQQEHQVSSGEVHECRINGIKSLDQFEDELLNTFVWLWSIKDYLKASAKANSRNPQEIEEIANANPALGYVADIANGIKHGTLTKSRSGKFVVLGEVGVSIPQEAIAAISFGAQSVSTELKNPDLAEYKAMVLTRDGDELGVATDVLKEALDAWESAAAAQQDASPDA